MLAGPAGQRLRCCPLARQGLQRRALSVELKPAGRASGSSSRSLPFKPAIATSNSPNELSSSSVPKFGCRPGASWKRRVRSPRQCCAPWLARPRRVCVDIGPLLLRKSPGCAMSGGVAANGAMLIDPEVVAQLAFDCATSGTSHVNDAYRVCGVKLSR